MDSYNGTMTRVKIFGGGRPIHAALGGGKVADLLLWKDKKVSATVLVGVAVVWFLFEVVDYSFVTLLCQSTITTMLIVFIWATSADVFKWTPPKIPQIILHDSTFTETASFLHSKSNQFLSKLLYIACGNDPKFFFLVMNSLWILSMIGNYTSISNVVFFGLLCLEILPFLYERYEEQVDHLASKMYTQMIRTYKKLEADVLGKIPRAPGKDKGI